MPRLTPGIIGTIASSITGLMLATEPSFAVEMESYVTHYYRDAKSVEHKAEPPGSLTIDFILT